MLLRLAEGRMVLKKRKKERKKERKKKKEEKKQNVADRVV